MPILRPASLKKIIFITFIIDEESRVQNIHRCRFFFFNLLYEAQDPLYNAAVSIVIELEKIGQLFSFLFAKGVVFRCEKTDNTPRCTSTRSLLQRSSSKGDLPHHRFTQQVVAVTVRAREQQGQRRGSPVNTTRGRTPQLHPRGTHTYGSRGNTAQNQGSTRVREQRHGAHRCQQVSIRGKQRRGRPII